jgi:hypothetical protein
MGNIGQLKIYWASIFLEVYFHLFFHQTRKRVSLFSIIGIMTRGVSRAAEAPPPPMAENFYRFSSRCRRRRDPNSLQPPPLLYKYED